MLKNNCDIEGLMIFNLHKFEDVRGLFYEFWRSEDYKKQGIHEFFVQDNVSISKKNVLRGLHFQKNQAQLVTVTHGKIFDVVVDIRRESKTYGQYFSAVLDSENPKQIYMPPGFAHGFCVLSEIAIINYKCTQYYNKEDEGGIVWNDPYIAIKWPLHEPILSKRDASFKKLGHNP